MLSEQRWVSYVYIYKLSVYMFVFFLIRMKQTNGFGLVFARKISIKSFKIVLDSSAFFARKDYLIRRKGQITVSNQIYLSECLSLKCFTMLYENNSETLFFIKTFTFAIIFNTCIYARVKFCHFIEMR